MITKKIYLASQSPRRRQILTQLGLDFDIVLPDKDVDEKLSDIGIDEALKELALRKARAVMDKVTDGCIVAADTVVVLSDRIFGKPHTREKAFEMLSTLSGKVHQVKTGVCVLDKKSGRYLLECESTDVHFLPLDENTIWEYVNTDEPNDKAGAYGYQEKGARLVSRIEGCYYNVVGLPAAKTLMMIKELYKGF